MSMEQIVSQFLLKTLHIVLESRVPSIRASRGGPLVKKSDKWFNLALGERPAALLDSLSFWHRNLTEPMIIDIILVQSGYGRETVIERWVVQYEYSSSSSRASQSSYKKTYKKSIILLRSLYAMMRLLPAYRAFRNSKAKDFDITYKLSSFSTSSEEQEMKLYSFFPVEAQHGRLSVSVRYRESLSDFNLETSPSFPPEIITDYVGSPATDPFRAFPTTTVRREIPPPQARPHSWTGGGPFPLNQSPPAHHHHHHHSSSAARYDLSSSYDQRSRPPTDDSPPFSPSPPTIGVGKSRPVSIPITRTPRYLSPNLSDPPNRHSLPPLSPRSSSPAIRSKMSRVVVLGDLSSASGSGSANHKDDSGRFSGLLSSSGSPRIGFSRSSSRLSLQDELDDIDFSCPFIVDDVDSPLSQSGVGGKQGKKSQDAAVGALVRMLRTAPPLRQDSSCCCCSEAQSNTSGLFMSRKTSDALEELKAYTGIKHLILSKSKDTL